MTEDGWILDFRLQIFRAPQTIQPSRREAYVAPGRRNTDIRAINNLQSITPPDPESSP